MDKKYWVSGFEKKLGSPIIEGDVVKQSYKITLSLDFNEDGNGGWIERDFCLVLKPKSRSLKPICRKLKGKCMTIEEIKQYFLDNSLEYKLHN